MFNNRKKYHSLPLAGQKVVATKNETWHWFADLVERTKLLEIGKEYTIISTDLASSSTSFYLEEFEKNARFCASCFDWEAPPLIPEEWVGEMAFDILGLRHRYKGKMGVFLDGEEIISGTPVLMLTSDGNVITNAEIK